MSKQVLTAILDSFESPDSALQVKSRTTKKTAKTKSAQPNKQQQKVLNVMELYKSMRTPNTKHVANLKNLKRKFFKHNLDKATVDKNKGQKGKGSVFSDKDFECIIPK